MALTTVTEKNDVMGSMAVKVIKCTFTGVTDGIVKTGLNNIVFAIANNESGDQAISVYKNRAAADATVVGGSVFLAGITAGDVVTLLVFGN